MGAAESKYDLRREKVIENLTVGGLADLLGYVNGEESMNLITTHTCSNWHNRGNNAVKDALVNLCTFAVSGQGKTELCRQLAIRSEQLAKELRLDAMVPVPITFNQFTTFSAEEVGKSVEDAMKWRILYAFGNTEHCNDYPHDLRNLLKSIRQCNAPISGKPSSVGIFLLVDEILKVRDVDELFFKRVLDTLTNLQQRELRENLPTFILVTSLELVPVSDQIIIGSGRKLQLIPMPFLRDFDLDIVAERVLLLFREVLSAGHSSSDTMVVEIDRFGNLELLIRVAVSLSGRHFRCLEESLKALYQRVVSPEQHQLALQSTTAVLPKVFTVVNPVGRRVQIFSKKEEGVDLSVKEIFDTVVNEVEMTHVSMDHYQRAADLFLQLLNDPNMYVHERELYDLEAMKIVFVKSRHADRVGYIVPRINLPFLFLYPRAERFPQQEVVVEGGQTRKKKKSCELPELPYLRLRDPAALKLQVKMLLSNVGTALAQPISKLASTFEKIMIWLEMTAVAASCVFPVRTISLEDIIPHVLFRPWSTESLCVSEFVMRGSFHITCQACADEPASGDSAQLRAVKDAVRCANDASCEAVYVVQGSVYMERIEHVSRLFSVRGQPVLCLCSMKLREQTDPVRLARDLHQYVRDKINDAECHLSDGRYYAMIYCCTPMDSLRVEDFPPGTIVVPFEAVRELLYPFGLSKLLFVAEEKNRASKRG